MLLCTSRDRTSNADIQRTTSERQTIERYLQMYSTLSNIFVDIESGLYLPYFYGEEGSEFRRQLRDAVRERRIGMFWNWQLREWA